MMKLDKVKSKKYVFIDELDQLDSKMQKIKLQNGLICVGSGIIALGVLDSFFDIISPAIQSGDMNIVQMLLKFLILAFGSVAIERMIVKHGSNCDKLELLEKDYELTEEYEELTKILENKKTR